MLHDNVQKSHLKKEITCKKNTLQIKLTPVLIKLDQGKKGEKIGYYNREIRT